MVPRLAPGANVVFSPNDFDDIRDEDFEDRNIKIRVTTFVDLDVVKELKRQAKNQKSKYQTLLNKILRDYAFSKEKDTPITESRLRKIIREEMKRK